MAGCQNEVVTHGCRRSFQTDCVGAGNDGSANDPIATAVASGFRSGSQNTVEPQTGQKWKVIAKPLSDERLSRISQIDVDFTAYRSMIVSPIQ